MSEDVEQNSGTNRETAISTKMSAAAAENGSLASLAMTKQSILQPMADG